MAGVVNAPTRYSPILHPEISLKRRDLVLAQMAKYGFISYDVYDSVKKLPLGVKHFVLQSHNTGEARYFREYLRGEMKKWCKTHFKPDGKPYNLYKDGLKIYTTIDSRMQRYAEEAVREHLSQDLQPAFYKHWEGYTFAPFAFKGKPEEIKRTH
jgi:penicillin-binding protein 1A